MKKILIIFYLLTLFGFSKEVYYHLVLEKKNVNFTGQAVEAMTINGNIPGPTLEAQEGDWLNIKVINKMDEDSSIHWHGILLPGYNNQDGVPYLTTPPIKAFSTANYRFKLVQSGTYWYHSHTRLQEQKGVYGSIVIHPQKKVYDVDQEYVVVLSDWTNEDPQEVMRTLKRGSEYYSIKKGTVQSLWGAIQNEGVGNMLTRWKNRMPGMDISDVYYDAFLINGKPSSTLKAKKSQTIRLRIINASASTYFYLQYAGGTMKVIAADGIDVQPFEEKRMLIAVAETYDVIVTAPTKGAFELRATAQDGSGQASLFIGDGQKVSAKDIPKPNQYGMKCGASMEMKPKIMKCGSDKMAKGMKCGSGMSMGKMDMAVSQRPLAPYAKLKALQPTALSKSKPYREVHLTLTGDMRSYLWSFNGKTVSEEDTIPIKKGENVRFIFKNTTMMHHPLHLHGHFFRVVNENGEYSPLKHTVDIAPFETRTIEFSADYEKDWLFHCHILYHMMSGMTRVVSYQTPKTQEEKENYQTFLKHFDKWYAWGNILILNTMNEGLVKAASGKNSLIGYWESDYDQEFDSYFIYNRYIDPYSSWFAGVSYADRESRKARPIIGFNYMLPGLIDTKVWIDSNGDGRIWFTKEIMLTNNTGLELEYRYDTELKEEWSATLDYRINKQFSLDVRYHSETKWGVGFRWFF